MSDQNDCRATVRQSMTVTLDRTEGRPQVSRMKRLSAPAGLNFAAFVGLLLGISASVVGVRFSVASLNLSSWIVLVSLVITIARHPQRLISYRFGTADYAILAFIFIMLSTEVLNAEQLLREVNPYIAVNWAFLYAAYLATRIVCMSHDESVRFLEGVVLLAPFISIFGILQTIQIPLVIDITMAATSGGASALERFTEDDKLIRATALIGHWTGFGSYLTAMTVGILVLVRLKGTTIRTIGSLIVLGLGIIATLTFSVIICYFILVITFFLSRRQLGRLALFLAMFGSGAAVWFGDVINQRLFQQYGQNSGAYASSSGIIPETLVYRISIWVNETIPSILERPLFGWGNGVYSAGHTWPINPTDIVWNSPESQWFGIAMQAGVAGLTGLAFVVISMFVVIRNFMSGLRLLATIYILVCLVTSFTVSQFTNAGLPGVLVLLLACLAGIKQASGTDASDGSLKNSLQAVGDKGRKLL